MFGTVYVGVFGWWRLSLLAFACALCVITAHASQRTTLSAATGGSPPVLSVSSFEASHRQDGLLVQWRTAYEVGILSYDLFILDKVGGWIAVNADPIVALNFPVGGTYQFEDKQLYDAAVRTYKLVAVDQYNRRIELGPFAVAPSTKAPTVSPSAQEIDSVSALAASESPLAPSSSAALRITTTNSGIQILSAQRIATSSGKSLAAVQTALEKRTYRLSHKGQNVGYSVSGTNNAILFHAQSHKDNYSDKNVFFLDESGGEALVQIDAGTTDLTQPTIYKSTVLMERDLLAVTTFPLEPNDDFWMWTRLVAGLAGFDTVSYPVVLDRVLLSSNETATISLNVWGANTTAHRVQLTVNGQSVTNADWNFISSAAIQFNFPANLLRNGTNTVTLKALVNGSPSPRSQWYVDNFSLSYPRHSYAIGGQLEFTAVDNAPSAVDGFSSNSVEVFDITDPLSPVVLTNLSIAPSGAGFIVRFLPTAMHHYIVFQNSAGVPVEQIAPSYPLETTPGNYVIVAPRNLLSSATNLASYRNQRGLQASIVPFDSLCDAYADGFPSPDAIRNFLLHADNSWSVKPRFLTLLGDGTYDSRNILGKGDNLIPPMMAQTPYGLFASDIAYGDLDSNGTPDLAVGRIPADSNAEALEIISKIQTYESSAIPSVPGGLLVSDLPDEAGNFNENMQLVDEVLSNKFATIFIRRSEVTNANAMANLITNAWNSGVDLVNYAGHGAIDRFGSSGYLTSQSATNLKNSKLPVVLAVTCVAGQFSVPGNDCLGEHLVRRKNGGAIAVIAPTGLSWNNEAMDLNLRLSRSFKENAGLTIGEMFQDAIAQHVSLDSPTISPAIYNLIGDPALQFRTGQFFLPPHITARNPAELGSAAVTLSADVIPYLASSIRLEYGTTTNYGGSLDLSEIPSSLSAQAISQTLTNLLPQTTYFYRFVASNQAATTVGQTLSFSTLPPKVPSIELRNPVFNNERKLTFEALSSDAGVIVVETSLDLVQWVPVYTNSASSGSWSFVASDEGVDQSRFYRVRTVGTPP